MIKKNPSRNSRFLLHLGYLLSLLLISPAAKSELLLFSDLHLAANPNFTAEKTFASDLSNDFIQLSGEAFMQWTSVGAADTTLHMGNELLLEATSNNNLSIVEFNFSQPIATAVFNLFNSPDYVDASQEQILSPTLKLTTPHSADIELFDVAGSSVGFFENYSTESIAGIAPFTKAILTYTDGLGTLDKFPNSSCPDPDCIRETIEVAITGHLHSINYTPIPEPSTYLMLLVGMGLIYSWKAKKILEVVPARNLIVTEAF